jgi:hypothetical protein
MLFLALAGITGVCLAFAELRLLAVVGLAALLFLNPLLTLALFVTVAVAALVLNQHVRRSIHGLRRLHR